MKKQKMLQKPPKSTRSRSLLLYTSFSRLRLHHVVFADIDTDGTMACIEQKRTVRDEVKCCDFLLSARRRLLRSITAQKHEYEKLHIFAL